MGARAGGRGRRRRRAAGGSLRAPTINQVSRARASVRIGNRGHLRAALRNGGQFEKLPRKSLARSKRRPKLVMHEGWQEFKSARAQIELAPVTSGRGRDKQTRA